VRRRSNAVVTPNGGFATTLNGRRGNRRSDASAHTTVTRSSANRSRSRLNSSSFGFSRDDINKFLPSYLAEGILKQDPFAVLDRAGVGKLVRRATVGARKTNPKIKVGICGEHGGDPSSVEFCHQIGLNYVSCSPFRVLTARLAAAQAAASDKLKVEGGRTK